MFFVFTFTFFKHCIATFSDLEPEEPPRFGKKLNQETVVLEGDPFSLQLQVFGNPKPNVTWYFEDQPLEENEFMRITSKGGWHKVEFDEVLVDDEGFYRCVAENELGVVETETSLLVDGKLFLSIPPHSIFSFCNKSPPFHIIDAPSHFRLTRSSQLVKSF